MEGPHRLIGAYNESRCRLCCIKYSCDCCLDKKDYKRKLFQGKFLKVERAVEPSLIIWENLGITKKRRCCRILFSSCVAFILLLLTTLLILYVKLQEIDLKEDVISCSSELEITQEAALLDFNLPEDQQSNKMYCYCRSLLWKNLAAGSDPLSDLKEEFSDGEEHCVDWLTAYSLQKTLLYGVPFSILFVNWVSKTVLRLLTRLEGY